MEFSAKTWSEMGDRVLNISPCIKGNSPITFTHKVLPEKLYFFSAAYIYKHKRCGNC